MPTHEDPPPGVAPVLLGIVEGAGIGISLDTGDSLLGEVLEEEQIDPGHHFDILGKRSLVFEAAGVRFRLTMHYRELEDGTPEAETLDLRLVHGFEWSIPITAGIEGIYSR